jgi:signal transduction histidine kinase
LKDEFLAVLSHELRTPLNAIVGYSRLLSGGVLSTQKAARGLEILERNATWLTQIVEDVLDVSRIVSGKIRLDVQPVDLALIVDNAVATVQPAADAKGIRVQSIVDPRRGTGVRRSRTIAASHLEPALERREIHVKAGRAGPGGNASPPLSKSS